ncbi:hypothetical protein NJC08_25370, partial [Pseudomonas fluorescens]
PNTARGGAAKQTVGAAPRMNPAAKEPEPKRGPNVRVKPFGLPFRRLEKVTRRKGETLGGHYRSNGYSQSTPKVWSAQRPPRHKKKGQPKSPQNALRAHQTRKDLLLAFIRILPDKKSKPCKKQNHETYGQNPGKHHVIEKHDCGLLAPALLRWS